MTTYGLTLSGLARSPKKVVAVAGIDEATCSMVRFPVWVDAQTPDVGHAGPIPCTAPFMTALTEDDEVRAGARAGARAESKTTRAAVGG